MSAPTCVVCERPTPDGYACVNCAIDRPRQLLAEITDMLGAARDIAHRQARHGSEGGSGKPGSEILIDLGATARLDAVQAELTTWARHIAEERGVSVLTGDADPITVAAGWLADHLEWMRHRAEVAEWLRDLEACARIVRGLARGPADRVYLGPCGAPREHALMCSLVRYGVQHTGDCDCCCWCCDDPDADTCDGDVYGLVDGDTGRCRTCGAEYGQAERLEQVTALVDGKAFRAAVIAHAYGISADTIRSWATERRAEGRVNPETGIEEPGVVLRAAKLHAVGHDEQGRPLYLVRDVLALHGEAQRRREQRAAQAAEMGA